jgi:molybdopterin converting factor subunit 1
VTLEVKLFARAAELAGAAAVSLTPPPATVGELRRRLAQEYSALAGLLAHSAVAVNQEFAGDDTPLSPGDEVAVLPPVSGG